ncbi:MAG: hypothetical protein QMD05_10825, partial [Candidatus Brocadiaceae bacterium]|nr:hypothetical protein [Candidatus Brocadiaceae bacterium]
THHNPVGAIHELPLHIQRRKMTIPKIVGYYKMNTAKAINKIRNTPGIPVWQRNYYEHVLRNEDKLNRTREYVLNNPLQWQFDRENPGRIQDKAYDNQWGHLEAEIYGEAVPL